MRSLSHDGLHISPLHKSLSLHSQTACTTKAAVLSSPEHYKGLQSLALLQRVAVHNCIDPLQLVTS